MEIIYVFMKFPAPSEVFAANEVKRLINEHGAKVTILSFRGLTESDKELLDEFGLSNIEIITPAGMLSAYEVIVVLKEFMLLLFWGISRNLFWHKKFFIDIYIALIASVLKVKSRLITPDVVHCFWGHRPAWFLQCIRDKNAKKTLFLGAYDLFQKLPISRYVGRSVADLVYTHSKVGVDELCKFGISREKIRLVYRGVDIDKFKPYISERVGFDDKKGFVSAGRLIPQKGFFDLARFFSNNCFQSELIIYGDGAEKRPIDRYLKAKGTTSVQLCGRISQVELFQRFVAARFFVFNSSKTGEILPNVVKEAMLAGCVVICKRIPAIDELLEDGITGFIIDDMEEIRRIADLPQNQIARIGANARLRIMRDFDSKDTMATYLDCWSRL